MRRGSGRTPAASPTESRCASCGMHLPSSNSLYVTHELMMTRQPRSSSALWRVPCYALLKMSIAATFTVSM